MRFLAFVLVMGTFLVPPALEAHTIYVTPDGTGDATTIAEGISLAADGDTVLVACGTYYECDLFLQPGAGGSEITLRSETGDPDCVTIDGQGEGYYVLGLEGGSARIEGITVTGGRAPEWSGVSGGLLGFSTVLDVSHCNFVGNEAPAKGARGGAVFLADCLARFEDCGFSENVGFLGGAMAFAVPSDVDLLDCEFRGNLGYAGGGLCAGLVPDRGTGGDSPAGRAPAWLRSAVRGLGVTGMRGQPLVPRVAGSGTRLKMIGCGLYENVAVGGGGLLSLDCQSEISRCLFARNEAQKYGGAGMYAFSGYGFLEHCTFAENRSAGGACLFLEGGAAELWNTIVALNTLAEAVGVGQGAARLSCCDIWGNQGGDWVGPIGEQYGVSGNFCAPPIFCYMPNHRYFLAENSPCLNRGECGQVGAFGVGCPGRRIDIRDRPPSRGARAPEAPEGVPSTWGLVKQIFE